VSFRLLHERPGRPLIVGNAWDVGSALLLRSLGFAALATTSSGFGATLGRRDYAVSREEALAYAKAVAEAVDIPVTGDLEDGFGAEPEQVAETVAAAARAGLAGGSIEDYTGDPAQPIHDLGRASERIAAAADAAAGSGADFVLTARAENHLHSRHDLEDTIRRLRAYEAAGADVLYAPGLRTVEDIRRVVESVGAPVNVLVSAHTPPVSVLAELGVRRVSVGGLFAFAALGAAVEAARELLEEGTSRFTERAAVGRAALDEALRR
jgi:2-methylisocitrate lyase-like PEP mutase family enzyme